MKLFVASDIHGSALYCRKMLERFEIYSADKLLLLGDLLYHGPRNDLPEEYDPKRVIAMLSEYKSKIIAVRGNCEAEVDDMVLPFPIMADYAVIFIGEKTGKTIYATHGHRYSPNNPINMQKGDIMLYGHTHVPVLMKKNNNIFINPGSVSIPKENSPHSYMIIDSGDRELFRWYELDGNEYIPQKI